MNLHCARCGNDRFPLGRLASDASIVRCEGCGHEIGTLAELKERVEQEIMASAAARGRATA